MIDLAALTSLRAVDTHGSVVAAADALGFTPSAISQQVKRLEKQAGVPLLERVGRGVMLTDTAAASSTDGSRLLPTWRSSSPACTETPGGSPGACGWPPSPRRCAGWSRRSCARCSRHPDLVFTLTEREPWDTIDLVASGQQDLGIVHSWGDVRCHPRAPRRRHIARDVADVIVPSGHRLAGRTRVSPRDLVDEAWVATPEGTSVASG